MRALLAIVASAVIANPALSDESPADLSTPVMPVNNNFAVLDKHIAAATLKVLDLYGGAYRVSSALRACSLDGLATAVEPGIDALSKPILEYATTNFTDAQLVPALLAGVRNSLAFYRVAYQEAWRSAIDGQAAAWAAVGVSGEQVRAGLCDNWTKVANSLLQQREPATKKHAQQ